MVYAVHRSDAPLVRAALKLLHSDAPPCGGPLSTAEVVSVPGMSPNSPVSPGTGLWSCQLPLQGAPERPPEVVQAASVRARQSPWVQPLTLGGRPSALPGYAPRMALLEHTTTARTCCLGQRVVVGRSRAAALRIKSRAVSNEHAVLFWDGGWRLRDLGSRNGTWVDGDRLAPGTVRPLGGGEVLRFGDDSQDWVLANADGPTVMARRADGTATVAADGGLLGLPSAEDPTVTLFATATGWHADGPGVDGPVADGQVLAVDDVGWVVHLPTGHEATWTAHGEPEGLEAVQIAVAVSLDEEHVEVRVRHGVSEHALRPRAHLYLLALLARARLADAALPPAERGWQDAQTLQRGLSLDRRALNVQVYRIRQDFLRIGVPGAAGIVERRTGSGALRIGTDRVTVGRL